MHGDAGQRKRRGHNKSRNGCQQCKKSHTKCDETHPRCLECTRLRLTCSFGISKQTAEPATSDATVFSLDDMSLLFRWMKGDTPLFDDHDPESARVERYAQVELALAHPYLLHSILAIAALDRFRTQTSEASFHQQAVVHNTIALKHARPSITNSSKDHSAALYLFSAFSMFFALAEPPLRLLTDLSGTVRPISDLLSAFRMGKGIDSIGKARQIELQKEGLPNKSIWHDDRTGILAFESQFRAVEMLINENLPDGHLAKECTKAGKELFSIMALLQQKSSSDSSAHLIATWSIHLDVSVLQACEEASPVPLILLAHYAVALYLRRNLWFFEQWPAVLLDDIEQKIGQAWSKALAWPKHVITGEIDIGTEI